MPIKAVKEFALRAQRRLSAEIKQKASGLGIRSSGISGSGAGPVPAGTGDRRRERLRRDLLAAIALQEAGGADYLAAYEQVLSGAAYSCFSCLIALRFLELNAFLPGEEYALSAREPGDIPGLSPADQEQLTRLQAGNKSDELCTFLFIKKCQSLAPKFPSIFAGIPDYLELLLGLSYEDEDGLIWQLLHTVPEADFDLRQGGQVEIIGWFYQYFTADRRDEIISLNVKQIEKADIPTATQVFTPDWIVRYLLDNSLGRCWLEGNPDSPLREKLEFYVEPKGAGPAGSRDHRPAAISPRELTVLDPCVGSGHILLYAFDLLLEIYRESGYSEAAAAREIVQYNLHGLDIDQRVVNLANFAVTMKARSYDPDFFDSGIEVRIFTLAESKTVDSCRPPAPLTIAAEAADTGDYLLELFREAGEIGSLLQADDRDYQGFLRSLDQAAVQADPLLPEHAVWLRQTYPLLKKLARQAVLLAAKYRVVCTNPPYMNRFAGRLKSFVRKNYYDYRRDLFSVYIFRNFLFCQPGGYSALMTPYVWMFIKSYEKLRRFIVRDKAITTLVQLEYSAFDAATVPVCAFVLKNAPAESKGLYIKLTEFTGGLRVQEAKLRQALAAEECAYFFESQAKNFCKLPSTPIAYWAGEEVFDIFEQGRPMKSLVEARQGLASGDNRRFLRLWFEVERDKINFEAVSVEDFHRSGKLYAPHDKGGPYRRWYGNSDYVIKFDRENFDILAKRGNCLPSRQFYFRPAISWSLITSAGFSIRYRQGGSVPNVAGNSAFSDDPELLSYLLALLSTPIADYLFKMMNPTLNLNVGDFDNFPVLPDQENQEEILQLAADCVRLARADWDSFEVSPDFSCQPLVDFPAFQANYLSHLCEKPAVEAARPRSLSAAYDLLKEHFRIHFEQLRQKEARLNRIFIDLYGLEAELEAAPVDRDISSSLIYDSDSDVPPQLRGNRYVLTKPDLIKQFISYALGCMLGRYSLDEPGLFFAGGEWRATAAEGFQPSPDNVLTLTDAEYFDDDIVRRLAAFLVEIYGSDRLEENLIFIAGGLSPSFRPETDDPRAVIRNYFLRDFFRDHCRQYSVNGSGRRPIYWLFDSGKENGFKALIYIHRYRADVFELLRSKYLRRQIQAYKDELAALEVLAATENCRLKRSEYLRRQAKLQGQLAECCSYAKKLKCQAQLRIDLDLDDGVLTNYQKLQTAADGQVLDLLAPL
ncbi:MAG: BREX-1 system adenine-specific DNA-methyltransferase PglX [Clostridiaceae bacterium]|nr:BREX-1 system adenine-specific DNA-methyltransferase PglX [Clostridiaceae bacterium]